jgi:ATP-dependent RNA helicase DeaD
MSHRDVSGPAQPRGEDSPEAGSSVDQGVSQALLRAEGLGHDVDYWSDQTPAARSGGMNMEDQTGSNTPDDRNPPKADSQQEAKPEGEGGPKKRRRRGGRGRGRGKGAAGAAPLGADDAIESDDADATPETLSDLPAPEGEPVLPEVDADPAQPGPAPVLAVDATHPVVHDSHDPQSGVIKTRGDTFDATKTFADLGLRNSVLKGVTESGFTNPTLIQAQLIPRVLFGKDVLGQAKTGTGKTAAFGLPLLHLCNKDAPFQALVLAPTRELAIQITEEINELGKHTPIRAGTIYGGQAIKTQADKLKKGFEIVVGTPGRVMDMVQRGLLHFRNVRFAVLDEVDRMLDIGFREDIRRILEMTPPTRQTVVVSATFTSEIEKLARRYMRDPEKITTSGDSLTVSRVRQFYLAVNPWDKRRLLVHLLKHEDPAMTIVFCRLKRTVDELAKKLTEKGIAAHAMHGDLSQGKRNSTMEQLRRGNLSVVIASDLASRGIDVEGITHVINYDLPDDPDLYVHRIGRTARAGRDGVAWSLVTPEQGDLLTSIEMLVNAEIPKLEYPDFVASPRPEGWRDASPGGRPMGGLTLANAPKGPEAPPPEKVNRIAASSNVALPAKDGADPSKFPGGVIPTKLPPKRMFGKMRTGR